MNREIKFRAWDEQNEVMYYDFQGIKSGDNGNDWIIFSSDKQAYNPTHPNPYFSQQLKVMQFTGCYDKNGKEIYEGDKVVCSQDGFSSSVGVIEYNTEKAAWYITIHIGMDLSNSVPYMDFDSVDIIGNVFEPTNLVK